MRSAFNVAVGGALLVIAAVSLLVQMGWLNRDVSGWLLGAGIFACGLGGLVYDLWTKYYRGSKLVSVVTAEETKTAFLQIVREKKSAQD